MKRTGRGWLVAFLVALSVLIHHESARWMVSSPHLAGHSMTAQQVSQDAGHGEGGGCSSSGMQMCTAASVDTVTVTLPVRPLVDCLPLSRVPRFCASIGSTVARGPPDLAVLSVLRI